MYNNLVADAIINIKAKEKIMDHPVLIKESKYRFDSFKNGEQFSGKKPGRLPAMGWNSWNAFGSGNTEELTKKMADCIVELGLDKLGYEYVVLDDGCYKPERVDGLLSNEEIKFPSGFRALADYIHSKGLKFGMYNDIGTNLCAGAAVGTCGHEKTDAKSYLDWGVDFIKVDNCYYLWDNATFSNPENARYTYVPRIKGIRIKGKGIDMEFSASEDGSLSGAGAKMSEDGKYAEWIGTFDGTGPDQSPVGDMSGELRFKINVPEEGEYELSVCYQSGKEPGCGEWLQAAANDEVLYDDLLPESAGFSWSSAIGIKLFEGENTLRLMNHRRQENTLCSYAALLEGFYEADKNSEVLLSICEWGKTQTQNWGYKVGDSWRILNDITFQVGADGHPGVGRWESDYTTSVCAQYNKAVIMDEYAGLTRGWNDPDMLMIAMDGLDIEMNKSHFAMWCMMNSPLMLGFDLRRITKDDEICRIISNKELIALNQDALGVQGKRVYTTAECVRPDKDYIRDNQRLDVLAKPLADGNMAVGFFNLSGEAMNETVSVSFDTISAAFAKMDKSALRDDVKEGIERFIANLSEAGDSLVSIDLWTGEGINVTGRAAAVSGMKPYESRIYKICF